MGTWSKEEVPEFMDAVPGDSQVAIPSTWRQVQPSMSSVGVITAPLKLNTASVQTNERENEGTQTEEHPQAGQTSASNKQMAAVAAFVNRSATTMEEELQRLAEEQEAAEPFSRGNEDVEPATCIFELTPFRAPSSDSSSGAGASPYQQQPHSSDNGSPGDASGYSNGRGGPAARGQASDSGKGGATLGSPNKARGIQAAAAFSSSQGHQNLVVTSLSWSSTGQTIAAAYGRYDIEGWCTDRGALVAWNLGREVVKPNKPDVMVDVDVCLMSCAFHPEHPALIAGGTFNGDLYVWDLSQEADLQRGRSDPLSDVRHQEPICSIVWQYSLTDAGKYGNRSQAFRLVTLAADGKVLVWLWHKLATPLYGLQLLWPVPGLDRKILWGGTCLSFVREMGLGAAGSKKGGDGKDGAAQKGSLGSGLGSNTFAVGTEGGRIFRCFFDLNDLAVKEFQKALANAEKIELRCPIKDASYASHAGAVYGLDCSPFQRDVFLTGGADGTVRMYHALKQQPMLTVEPCNAQIHAVSWSPARPMVFAAAAGDGRVYFYDLLRARDIIRPCLAVDGSPIGSPVYAQAFNPKRPEMFATGDAQSISIWRLPETLTTNSKGEAAMLRRLAAADDAAQAVRSLAKTGGL